MSIANSFGFGKEEALELYEEERKHERKARCVAREDSTEAEERATRQTAREKENLELRIQLPAVQNISGSSIGVGDIGV